MTAWAKLVFYGLVAACLAGVAAAQAPDPSRAANDPAAASALLEQLRAPASGDRSRFLEERNLELLGTGPVDPETYVLGPGDVLGIEVLGAFSLSAEDVVAADGTVTFPQIGTFDVAGLTLKEARELVLGRGNRTVREATLSLVLRSTRAFKAYVVGAVSEPGAIRAGATTRASEAVQSAGALAEDADLRNLTIVRRDGSEVPADLLGFLLAGDLAGNPTLEDGDVVLVPQRGRSLTFLGAVQYPGEIGYVEGDELGVLLSRIGFLPSADRSAAVLQRWNDAGGWDTLVVNAGQAVDGVVQVPLEDGDRILVRAMGDWRPDASVSVVGAVRFPGPVPIEPRRTRAGEAISAAGGLLEDAVADRVVLRRTYPADTVLVPETIPDKRYFVSVARSSERETVVDLRTEPGPVLEAGDVITVPRHGGWVEVRGQVERPALYDYQPDWSPEDYIKAAGGTAHNADKGKARVSRGAMGDVLFARDLDVLAPGDLLWVPEKVPASFWIIFRDIIAVTAQAAAIVIVVRDVVQ